MSLVLRSSAQHAVRTPTTRTDFIVSDGVTAKTASMTPAPRPADGIGLAKYMLKASYESPARLLGPVNLPCQWPNQRVCRSLEWLQRATSLFTSNVLN